MRTALRVISFSTLGFFLACGGADSGDGGFEDDAGSSDASGGKDSGPGDSGSPDSDACANDAAPKGTSSLADIGFPVGAGTATRTLVFDEPVTIEAGGLVLTPGAALAVTPSLPATATSFTVVATGLADVDYSLTVLASKTRDACGHALATNVTSKFTTGCAADTTAPTMTSATTLSLPPGATTLSHDLVFDEIVTLPAGAITVAGGTVTVTPALPASAASFHVEVSGLSASQSYDLTVESTGAADRCGNGLAADIAIPIAGQCVGDVAAPTITSAAGARRFATATYSHTFVFDEPVTIGSGGITVSNGASIAVTPALPATASSFTVDLGNLVDGTSYALTAVASQIADPCGHALAADQTLTLTGCGGDTAPPALVSNPFTGVCGGPTQTYELTFDELTLLSADALTVDGGATIASVTPALPARATSFTVSLGSLTGAHTLTVGSGKATDDCGHATSAAIEVSTGGRQIFDYSGSIVSFTVPVCSIATIEAFGAQGGYNPTSGTLSGLGARMKGEFIATAPREIKVLVGEQPSNGSGNGGGGGTFVVAAADNAPLVVAGGGGGSGNGDAPYKDGTTATTGQTSTDGGGAGGANGAGGLIGPGGFQSGAGGGLLTSGADGWTGGTGGQAFVLGGAGATVNAPARGGFGGGGSGSSYVVGGGGGGYSGGGTSSNSSGSGKVGCGGGSFNAGTNQDNASGVRAGHGRVVVTWR